MKNKIAVIDYWSDYNRGDAMMQVAILQLIDQWPAIVSLDSGVNEYRRFSQQLDETLSTGDINFLPSPKFSYYFRKPGKIRNALNKLVLVVNFLIVHFFVLIRFTGMSWLLPKSIRNFFNAIDEADIVVWNGRNFRSNNKFFEFFEFFDLCCAAICAIYMKKKVYALGVSIWTPKSLTGLTLLRKVFSRCSMVYAREDVSLKVLKEEIIPGKAANCAYLPDLSFYYMTKNLGDASDLRSKSIFTIGIVPKDPVRRNRISIDDYANFIVKTVKEVVKRESGDKQLRFKFINQAVLENEPNDEAVELVSRQLKNIGEIVDPVRQPTLSDLSIAYRECDFVISSRMHGCILSSFFNRPFIGIPYDAGAKWGILERLGDCVLIPMESIKEYDLPLDTVIERSKKFDPREAMNQEADEIIAIVNTILERR